MDSKRESSSSPSPKSEPQHDDDEMATLISAQPVAPHSLSAASKRSGGGAYRPTPAKTFQCRGFGDCRMVFSRSEHLARHIRKHTGERPFACHCSKQFSRLDNLRQHAQTVHADKAEENEAMMRELTSLHATMIASHKSTRRRGPTKVRPGTATGTEGVVSGAGFPPQSPTSPTFDSPVDSHVRNRHSFAAPSPTSPHALSPTLKQNASSLLGPHSPIPTPPGVRRTSPFSAQSPPPQRPSTTSPFANGATLPNIPSPFQNPYSQERTTTPFTPFNNPFESTQQPPPPPFVPPLPQAQSPEWDQSFVLGQPPLPSGKRAQRPVIDTSTHNTKTTPQTSLDSRSQIQAQDRRRPRVQEDASSHLYPPLSHAAHLPVVHPRQEEMTSHQAQWMSQHPPVQQPPLDLEEVEQHWQGQQNTEYYHYPTHPRDQVQVQPTTMEALQLGVGLGLGIDQANGEWPPEQVMEVDMVQVQDLGGEMYGWDDRPPPLSASSSTDLMEDEMAMNRRTSTWRTPPSISMPQDQQQPQIHASDLSTIQTRHRLPSASTLIPPTTAHAVDVAHQVLYHPPPQMVPPQADPPLPQALDSPTSPLAPPEKDRYRYELARQQLLQLQNQRQMRDELLPHPSAPPPGWSVDGSQQPLGYEPHPLLPMYPPPHQQTVPSSHHPMYGWTQPQPAQAYQQGNGY